MFADTRSIEANRLREIAHVIRLVRRRPIQLDYHETDGFRFFIPGDHGRSKARRLEALKGGACAQCHHASALPGATLCDACMVRQGQRSALVRERMIDAGTCPVCMRRPAGTGRQRCDVCAARQNAVELARNDARRAAGDCYGCGGATAGTVRCAGCRARRNAAARASRARRAQETPLPEVRRP